MINLRILHDWWLGTSKSAVPLWAHQTPILFRIRAGWCDVPMKWHKACNPDPKKIRLDVSGRVRFHFAKKHGSRKLWAFEISSLSVKWIPNNLVTCNHNSQLHFRALGMRVCLDVYDSDYSATGRPRNCHNEHIELCRRRERWTVSEYKVSVGLVFRFISLF